MRWHPSSDHIESRIVSELEEPTLIVEWDRSGERDVLERLWDFPSYVIGSETRDRKQ